MFAPFKNQKGLTLIELVVIIILIGVLAAIAVPRYVDVRDQALRASAMATLDAGRAAISLDFANQVLNGTYTDPLANTNGNDQVLTNASDLSTFEGMLQGTPNYPPNGQYGTVDAGAFQWVQRTDGTYGASSPQPPVFDGIIDARCAAANSRSGGVGTDCWVSEL